MSIILRRALPWLAIALGLFLVVNGVPRVLAPMQEKAPTLEGYIGAGAVDSEPTLLQRYRGFLQVGSRMSAGVELILGLALILGFRTRLSLFLLGATVILFSAFLVVAALMGMPVRECNCLAFVQDLPLSTHLVINGLLLCAAAIASLLPVQVERSPREVAQLTQIGG